MRSSVIIRHTRYRKHNYLTLPLLKIMRAVQKKSLNRVPPYHRLLIEMWHTNTHTQAPNDAMCQSNESKQMFFLMLQLNIKLCLHHSKSKAKVLVQAGAWKGQQPNYFPNATSTHTAHLF